MFSIYGTLIIVTIYGIYISSHIEKSTWYESESGLDSLTGGPRKMRRASLRFGTQKHITSIIDMEFLSALIFNKVRTRLNSMTT